MALRAEEYILASFQMQPGIMVGLKNSGSPPTILQGGEHYGAAEQTHFPSQVGNKVETAYRRCDLFDKRRGLNRLTRPKMTES
jgi:hypothetical protein